MAATAAAIDNLWPMGADSVGSIVLVMHGGETASIKTAGRR